MPPVALAYRGGRIVAAPPARRLGEEAVFAVAGPCRPSRSGQSRKKVMTGPDSPCSNRGRGAIESGGSAP